MTQLRLVRVAPLTGVVAVVLLIGALILEGQPPAADAATEEVLRYYADNEARLIAATVVGCLAALSLVWFGASLFATLRSAEGKTGRLSAIIFAGFVLIATGSTILFGSSFAAVQTVGEVPAEVTQILSVLGALLIAPFAVGAFVALLATAVAILRHGALPRWLGYVTIGIAVVSAIAAGFGASAAIATWILATAIWVLLVSIGLFVHDANRGPTPKPPRPWPRPECPDPDAPGRTSPAKPPPRRHLVQPEAPTRVALAMDRPAARSADTRSHRGAPGLVLPGHSYATRRSCQETP